MSAADVIAGKRAWHVECADALEFLESLPDDCIHVCVTSPPYFGLRDYGVAGQIGLEASVEEYVAALVRVFRAMRRALHPSGTLWLNLGDSYAATGKSGGGAQGEAWKKAGPVPVGPRGGHWQPAPVGYKPKDLLGVPWLVAFALRADGWYLRSACPWVKRNPMPESVADRPGQACEYVFLLSKRPDYFFDMEAVKFPDGVPPSGNGFARPEQLTKGGRGQPDRDAWTPGMGRNFRTSDLWFDSVGLLLAGGPDDAELLGFDVTLKPYRGAHFAVMPRGVVEPCVLAGTSAKGVCPGCGEPWRRVVKKDRQPTRPGKDTKVTAKMAGDTATAEANGWNRANAIGNRDPQRHCTTTETVGWEPGCGCGVPDTLPALVCDPFMGSGTVCEVAVDLGRRCVGSELNAGYLDLIRKRMATVTGPIPGMEDAA